MRFVAFSTFIIDYLREKKIFAKSASLSESELSEAVGSVSHSALLLFFMEMEPILEDHMFYKNSEGNEGNNHTYVRWYLKRESCS